MMLLPLVASADAVEINGIYYNLVSKIQEAEVTSNPNKYTGNVVIPEKVTYENVEYSVTSIGDAAFYGCSGLTSVTIPGSVTSIGESAFGACKKLTSVYISDITAWCNIDFSTESSNPLSNAHLYLNNSEVKDLVIPDGVITIKKRAFYGCQYIESVIIPNSVTSIGGNAFASCSSLSSLTIGENVTSIGGGAFQSCRPLTSVVIPNSVKKIRGLAFFHCTSLNTIVIGCNVDEIGTNAFGDLGGLDEVYCYAENVPTTASNVFYGTSLTLTPLHVPSKSVYAYKGTEPWMNFKEIVALKEGDPGYTGITNIKQDKTDSQYYDLKGNKLEKPTKGINIVNGKKVIIK